MEHNLSNYDGDYSEPYSPSHCENKEKDTSNKLDEVVEKSENSKDKEHEYYTPKNFFSPDIIMLEQSMIENSNENDDGARSSLLTFEPLYGPPSLPVRNGVTIPVHSERSLEGLLDELRLPPQSKNKFFTRMQRLRERYAFDSYDLGLAIALLVVLTMGICGTILLFF